jgi:hypothetical protein
MSCAPVCARARMLITLTYIHLLIFRRIFTKFGDPQKLRGLCKLCMNLVNCAMLLYGTELNMHTTLRISSTHTKIKSQMFPRWRPILRCICMQAFFLRHTCQCIYIIGIYMLNVRSLGVYNNIQVTLDTKGNRATGHS